MGFGKYWVVAIFTCFWIILPHLFLLVGLPAIEKTSIEQLTTIENPTIANALFVGVNWFAFYFKMITFKLPDAPPVVSIILIMLLVVNVLAFISIFQKD